MTAPRETGSITKALLHIRADLDTLLQPFAWKVLTAENPFQKFSALAAVGAGGGCVVAWNGDRRLDQAGRSLVIRASITITIMAKKDVMQPALGRLQGATPRLFEIHDRIKGRMLALSLPAEIVAEAGAEAPVYVSAQPLANPEGVPLDALEQTWEVELVETFGPN